MKTERLLALSDADLKELDAIAYAYRCAPRENPQEVADRYYRLAQFINGLIAEAVFQERCNCACDEF